MDLLSSIRFARFQPWLKTQKLLQLFAKRAFWAQNAQTNGHLLLAQTNHYPAISIYTNILFLIFCKIYFIDVYVNTYKYIYQYVYVYIWEYVNPCKLTFAWLVFSLGFRFVYVQKVEKYFSSKKWRVVIYIAKGFTARQKALMHSRQLYCTAKGFNA